jgi:hypothetical protein
MILLDALKSNASINYLLTTTLVLIAVLNIHSLVIGIPSLWLEAEYQVVPDDISPL